jgi:hypothetical protein
MDTIIILSENGEKILTKFQLVGFHTKEGSHIDILNELNTTECDTLVIEHSEKNIDTLNSTNNTDKYKFISKYEDHIIYTNDSFIDYLIKVQFKPASVKYFDNFPEAKLELGKTYLPAVIRPYGESEKESIRLIRDYTCGIEAIYDSLEKSAHRHVIIESYR